MLAKGNGVQLYSFSTFMVESRLMVNFVFITALLP